MPAPWSDYEPIVEHTLSLVPEARRSDFLDICWANDMGDDVIEHYLHTGRWEQMEYDRRVTDWELRRGFERY